MPRITGKKSPAEIAAQSVAKALKSALATAKAKAASMAKERAKVKATIGRTQKRNIHNVQRTKALEAEAEEDERMRKFWDEPAPAPAPARAARGIRTIKECKTIKKVQGKLKKITYNRTTLETGKRPITKRTHAARSPT